jgi:hypothetical protein
MGWAYAAVGMHSALESAIGLPRRSTKALRMLTFFTPADVRSLKMPPGSNQMERFHQCGPGITGKLIAAGPAESAAQTLAEPKNLVGVPPVRVTGPPYGPHD